MTIIIVIIVACVAAVALTVFAVPTHIALLVFTTGVVAATLVKPPRRAAGALFRVIGRMVAAAANPMTA
ncbi:hypothetical protein [Kitasatospora sp. NPDC047058]|uniref:hypothetical protein n=1 Tax=Kitasatospora sp. NPDC047058 TaxID=3155620 RepID=UPI0034076FD8